MKDMKTSIYYGSRKINYYMLNHCNTETQLVIFDENGDFESYYKNNKTGYCKNSDNKRITSEKFQQLMNTCKKAF